MEVHLTQIRTSPHIAVATGLKGEESGGLIKGGRGREKEGSGTKCVGGRRNDTGGVETTPPASPLNTHSVILNGLVKRSENLGK